ncbi:MAG: ABC transporter ATP-binding protein [Oscillospiraceae bacterium]|nr:ABC transporter ATP-binding protein [Oscillospiraceae bacterium]
MILEIKNLSCGYGKKLVINNFNASLSSGEVLCLLGPNGVGKTTLFKTILGSLPAKSGEILVDGRRLREFSRKEFARTISYVPQAHTPPFPFKVIDVIVMGRTVHVGSFASPGKKDIEAAEKALEQLGVSYLRNRIYTEISGGERQMVLIARALVQDTNFLMMDEPTSNLDFGNQVRVLENIKRLAKERNLGIIMTTHYPDHAFYCDSRVALIKCNNKYLEGMADSIITVENMDSAYGIHTQILTGLYEGETIRACVPVKSNIESFHVESN